MGPADVAALAAMLDQTMLKPEAGPAAYAEWVERSAGHGFASLCVPPAVVQLAAGLLSGDTPVCSVVGFPLGYATTLTKAAEAARLVSLGAAEVDMVVAIGPLTEGAEDVVIRDIEAVVKAAGEESGGSALVKVILETGYLTEAQIARGSELAAIAGADFVKTSTGFGPRGASVRDVEVMRAAVGSELGVKAAGGIRDLDAALALIDAGANRIGTSAGLAIVAEAAERD